TSLTSATLPVATKEGPGRVSAGLELRLEDQEEDERGNEDGERDDAVPRDVPAWRNPIGHAFFGRQGGKRHVLRERRTANPLDRRAGDAVGRSNPIAVGPDLHGFPADEELEVDRGRGSRNRRPKDAETRRPGPPRTVHTGRTRKPPKAVPDSRTEVHCESAAGARERRHAPPAPRPPPIPRNVLRRARSGSATTPGH